MEVPELLAPAGNLEKLKTAVRYGADAVYLSGKQYGLRAKAENFSRQEIEAGIKFAHNQGVAIYLTLNIIPHNQDLEGLPEYINYLSELAIDGVIIADPGVVALVQQEAPELDIHLSTQANNTNWRSAQFWQNQGIKRIVLARELSLKEISRIRKQVDLELEVFVHGAVCISYSGRCLLSSYLTNRDSNRGRCAHSCRWQYSLMEAERPGEYFPIEETGDGTYIFNSKDLSMIEHLPELLATGVDSLKLEGRMKSLHYVATVTNIYRQALDQYARCGTDYQFKPEWKEELKKISHRQYTTGFYLGEPEADDYNYQSSGYSRTYDFMGLVRDYLPARQEARVEVRNKFFRGDQVEFFGPETATFTQQVDYIRNQAGEEVETAPHPKELITLPVDREVRAGDLLRRRRGDKADGGARD